MGNRAANLKYRAKEMRDRGLTYKQIGKELGTDYTTIRSFIRHAESSIECEIEELTSRTARCLMSEGIRTKQQLIDIAKTEHDILKIPGLGKSAIMEIEEYLGFTIRENPTDIAIQRSINFLTSWGYEVIPPDDR